MKVVYMHRDKNRLCKRIGIDHPFLLISYTLNYTPFLVLAIVEINQTINTTKGNNISGDPKQFTFFIWSSHHISLICINKWLFSVDLYMEILLETVF